MSAVSGAQLKTPWEILGKKHHNIQDIQVDLIYIHYKATQDRLWMALALHVPLSSFVVL